MNIEINREMVLSTAHLPEQLARAMDRVGLDGLLAYQQLSQGESYATKEEREVLREVLFDPVQFGYRVYVSDDRSCWGSLPNPFPQLFELALANGCKWLVFDCDGPVVDGLPQWEW